MTGRRQHFIPAAYLGRFSARGTGALRDRPLWVMRRGAKAPFVRKAADLSFRRDLYTLSHDPTSEDDPFFIDKLWQSIEGGLPFALDALAVSNVVRLPASLWVTRLLPFFAGLFVRHPDWEAEFEKRLDTIMGTSEWRDWIHRDNSKQARLIEVTNMAGSLMAASWNILHFPTSIPVIASDRGYIGHRNPQFAPYDFGYAFPIDRSTVLTVFYAPNRRNRPRIRRSDATVARIRHFALLPVDARNFNEATAFYAKSEVYGPSPELVREATRGWGAEPDPDVLPPVFFAEDRAGVLKMQKTFLDAHRRVTGPRGTWPIVVLGRRRFLRRASAR